MRERIRRAVRRFDAWTVEAFNPVAYAPARRRR
ncbi:hypothetical protein SUDANB95_00379 [Actinosynnema sp. ALI-1.44]